MTTRDSSRRSTGPATATPRYPPLPRREITSRSGRRGFELDPAVLNDRSDIIAFLRTRRSTEPGAIAGPGPDDADLAVMLECATRVPDHGKMEPWRFIILRGTGKERFAAAMAARWRELHPDVPLADRRSQHDLMLRAPLVIVVVGRSLAHPRIPQWEQVMSVGASCMNLLTATLALGHAAQWRSGWLAEDARIARLLGVDAQGGEFIAGFFYIGSRDPDAPPMEDRRRPLWRNLTSEWNGPPARDDAGGQDGEER